MSIYIKNVAKREYGNDWNKAYEYYNYSNHFMALSLILAAFKLVLQKNVRLFAKT